MILSLWGVETRTPKLLGERRPRCLHFIRARPKKDGMWQKHQKPTCVPPSGAEAYSTVQHTARSLYLASVPTLLPQVELMPPRQAVLPQQTSVLLPPNGRPSSGRLWHIF